MGAILPPSFLTWTGPMEKRTLLEMVNDVAVSLDYETVNNIGDTPESERIERIIRNEYSKLSDDMSWPHLKVMTELNGLADATRPNFMQVPTTVAQVDEIQYDTTITGDTNRSIKKITICEDPSDFLDIIYSRNTGDSNVSVYNTAEGVPIWTITDKMPEYCTTFDDDVIIFDSYYSAEDSTLQGSKSILRGLRGDTWTTSDTFVPLMPVNMFSTFVSKCKVVANEQLRQVALNSEARDNRVAMNRQRRNKRVKAAVTKPNYGRGRS